MARGTAFSELVTRLKNQTGRSESVSVGVDELPGLKEAINTAYQTLYINHDWAHLKKTFARIPLLAGSRYYNFPTGLNSERVIKAVVWRDGKPQDLDRGIGFDDYVAYSSEDDERSEPALKWDVKWTGSTDQIEIWPLPSSNEQELQFIGIQAAPRLVADADQCLLDDDLVVLFAAAEKLGGSKTQPGKDKLAQAQDHLRLLKARGKGGEQSHQMGLGGYDKSPQPTFVVRIGHTS